MKKKKKMKVKTCLKIVGQFNLCMLWTGNCFSETNVINLHAAVDVINCNLPLANLEFCFHCLVAKLKPNGRPTKAANWLVKVYSNQCTSQPKSATPILQEPGKNQAQQ